MLVILFRDLICRLLFFDITWAVQDRVLIQCIFIAISWLIVLEMVSFKVMV